MARAVLKVSVATLVRGTVRALSFLVSESRTTRCLGSTWWQRRPVISEERIPVSRAMRTIQPSMGLL
ncbi:hypothetical protein D9M71_763240 [compost metagenome]